MRRVNSKIQITIVPEMKHADMIFKSAALQTVIGAIAEP
jgi:hypothetical protein